MPRSRLLLKRNQKDDFMSCSFLIILFIVELIAVIVGIFFLPGLPAFVIVGLLLDWFLYLMMNG